MPTYVYRRPDGTTFEAFQKISDPPLATDPESGEPVERVISGGAGLQFKGSGFYLTDYARPGGSKGDAKADGGSKAESKSETASPAKTSDKPATAAKSGD